MAGKSAFSINIKVDQVLALAQRLGAVSNEDLGAAMVSVLNQSVDSAYSLGRRRILRGINLTDDYVQRKMEVKHATSGKPEASITAYGGKGFITSLSHYGAIQLHKRVNHSNADISAAGHKFGKWPGWTKRTGNAAVGIPVDRKADGRSVEVIRGKRKRIGPAFAIPGKKDSDGNLLVFTRKKGSRTLEVLAGPSVYQLFRLAIPNIEGQVADDMEQAIIDAAQRHLNEAI